MLSPAPPESALQRASAVWQVQLLGRVLARNAEQTIVNFSSRSVAALLARLALFPQRSHAREELVELLWPGVAGDVGRNRLRQALFTLRQLLEPPGPVSSPVLLADRFSVRVVPGALDCDALRFEEALRKGQHALALSLYAGELLPGFYEDWIDDERLRYSALFERASSAASRADGAVAARAPVDEPGPGAVVQGGTAPGPVASADVGRSTLPVYLTRFFGRDAEGARLRAEVMGHRLVTLLGPGGSGKTRLAVELGAALRAGSPADADPGRAFDLVAFVSLVNCATRAQMLDALNASLHLRPLADDPLEALVAALTGRRALLLLDNFEQLSGHAEDVVARLAATIPTLHMLVTSRRVLGLDGEREVSIPPLPLPPRGMALNEAAINPAVALFVDRARAARADFHIGPSNLDAVIELAHLLEGMPLAIELAAARVRSIAPASMVALLQAARSGPPGQVLDLLHRSGPRSGADLRHASMLSVIAWSWRLLEPPQARLLAALTVFHGGFGAAAARAVCLDSGAAANMPLDDLVAHSLLRAQESEAGATRYSTFEPVREYAALQLDPAQAPVLRARHRQWMTDWAAALPSTPSLAQVRIEMPNLLAALAGALADGTAEAAIRLVLPLRRVLEDVELPAEGMVSLEAAVGRCTDAALRAAGHVFLAPLLFISGRSVDALQHAASGLAATPADAPGRARAVHVAARVRWRATRKAEGLFPLLDEAEALARRGGDRELQASALTLRASFFNAAGEPARGEALQREALVLWEQTGNEHAVNSGQYNLAVAAQNTGRHVEALARLDAIEPGTRRLHDWRRLSQIFNVRGNALCELGRWPEAAGSFRESARLAWECLALHELAFVLWNLPRALAHLHQPEPALQLSAFAARFWATRFGQLGEQDLRDLLRIRRLTALQLDPRRCDLLRAQGERLSLAEATALALR